LPKLFMPRYAAARFPLRQFYLIGGSRMVVIALLMVLLACPAVANAHEESDTERPTLTVTGNGQLALALVSACGTVGMETAGKSKEEPETVTHGGMKKVWERRKRLRTYTTPLDSPPLTVSRRSRPPPTRCAAKPSACPKIMGCLVS